MEIPTERKSYPHLGSVNSCDGSAGYFILTGSSDHVGRIFSGEMTKELRGHTGEILSVAVVNHAFVATASKDKTVRLWKADALGSSLAPFQTVGVPNQLNSIDAHPEGQFLCAGSHRDISIWNINEGMAFKSKFAAHVGPINFVNWSVPYRLYSAGNFDHKVKVWDPETQKAVADVSCGESVWCVDVVKDNPAVVACGFGNAGKFAIHDLRDHSFGERLDMVLHHHTNTVTCSKWHPTMHHYLLTGSADGKVILSDLRSSSSDPFFEVESRTNPVLCVDWFEGDKVIYGGRNNQLIATSSLPLTDTDP